jgi:dipeptidyl-peptidase-4
VEEALERDATRGLARLAPPGWESRPLLGQAAFLAALAAAGADEPAARAAWTAPFVWNAAGDAFLATAGGDFYLVDPARAAARRVTASPGLREAPVFSPDGARVACLRGNDLFVLDLATGRESRLTASGGPDRLNGRLDWLYREHVYLPDGPDRAPGPGAFRWSPDSRRIVFLSLDETGVPRYTLVDDRTRPQTLVTYPYPHPGEANPLAQVGVVDLEGKVTLLDDPHPQEDTLVLQVGWDPKGRPVVCYQNRAQTWVACVRFGDAGAETLVRDEGRNAWVEPQPLPVFLKDGGFLWRSARGGFQHLYRYDAQGRMRAQLTAGPWNVGAVLGVDEGRGRVCFTANQRNPLGVDAYSADLDGAAPDRGLRRLTERPGTHQPVLDPAATTFIDRWSDVTNPPQLLVANLEGRTLRQYASRVDPSVPVPLASRTTFQQIATRDGQPMETMLVLPPGFGPGRRWPVLQVLGDGPAPARNRFDPDLLWYHFLAQQGVAVWICNGRGLRARPAGAPQDPVPVPGARELMDQLDGLDWLRSQGWADMDRVGLYGSGYGGFLGAWFLSHSKAWKLGILAAPVADWQDMVSVVAERHLGRLEDNPDGYRAASPLASAPTLAGKVLLVQGTLDRSVHPRQTIRLLDALQQAGSGAPLVLLPGAGHVPTERHHLRALHQAMWTFLQQNL